MSETLAAAADVMRSKFAGSGYDGRVKFEIEGEGVLLVDGEEVRTEDGEADVTIRGSLATFRAMFDGDLAPTAAYMTGKISIDGDMGAAMKLSQYL